MIHGEHVFSTVDCRESWSYIWLWHIKMSPLVLSSLLRSVRVYYILRYVMMLQIQCRRKDTIERERWRWRPRLFRPPSAPLVCTLIIVVVRVTAPITTATMTIATMTISYGILYFCAGPCWWCCCWWWWWWGCLLLGKDNSGVMTG